MVVAMLEPGRDQPIRPTPGKCCLLTSTACSALFSHLLGMYRGTTDCVTPPTPSSPPEAQAACPMAQPTLAAPRP